MNTEILKLQRDERGLSTVEYVIILALVAVSAIGLWKTFGENIHAKIRGSSSELSKNVSTVPVK